jgi:kynurenine formamidase
MKRITIAGIAACIFLMLSCNQEQGSRTNTFPSGRWIDLTHDFSSETIYWPTAEPFTFDTVFAGITEKNYYYSAFQFCAAEHGGTHLDAPIHFAEGRKTVDELPLEQFIGPAVVIDVSAKALEDRDYLVGKEDFTEWEAKHGALPENVIVLLRTGYGQFWPDRVKYMGTDQRGQEAVADLHFPGLDPEAGWWKTAGSAPSAWIRPALITGNHNYLRAIKSCLRKISPPLRTLPISTNFRKPARL